MSLLSLLGQTAEIRHPDPGAEDEFGNETEGWTAWSSSVACRLEPLTGTENLTDRDTQIGDRQVFFPAGTDIDGRSQVRIDGQVYEVLGPEDRHVTPRGEHHVVARLRMTEGA